MGESWNSNPNGMEGTMNPNDWSAELDMINWIKSSIQPGSVMVELGSGDGTTRLLSKNYILYSVEHDLRWVNKYAAARYIYAPLVDDWYNEGILTSRLPDQYSLLIVDGPPSNCRPNIIHHLSLFRNIPMVIDDIERPGEKRIIASLLGSGYEITFTSNSKRWAVLTPRAI